MSGILLYVMGPSGAGKNSLIAYARNAVNVSYLQTWSASVRLKQGLRPVFFARRHITRPADGGGERHWALTQEEFQHRLANGAFALAWKSRGLCYGIGCEINSRLADGAVVVVNGSREYLPEALKRYRELAPVLISAQPDVLRARLEKRGREKMADVAERLVGAATGPPKIPRLIQVDNSRTLEESGRIFLKLFASLRRAPALAGG